MLRTSRGSELCPAGRAPYAVITNYCLRYLIYFVTVRMTADAKAAVAALLAAKDLPALEAAIGAASFLDNVPGDDRQKLRGENGEACDNAIYFFRRALPLLTSRWFLQLPGLACGK